MTQLNVGNRHYRLEVQVITSRKTDVTYGSAHLNPTTTVFKCLLGYRVRSHFMRGCAPEDLA
jgi:hypothetical protein